MFSLLALMIAGCTPAPAPEVEVAPVVDRVAFNAAARHLDLPMFMRHDGSMARYRSASAWQGTPDEAKAVVQAYLAGPADEARLDRVEQHRRALVRAELDAGRVSLLETDLSGESAAQRAFVAEMEQVATLIERLYALQTGASELLARVPADDPASRALFERNQGPWCMAPASTDPACSAIPGPTPRPWGLYPPSLLAEEGFCARLSNERPELLSPFTVVREVDGALVTVPYTEAWPAEMAAVAERLLAAAAAIEPDGEAALATYLRAAAKAFGDNDWFAADAAWAAMDQQNSRWYVRVAPDETYFEPCSEHASFALVLAQVDAGSARWQRKFEPVKQELEGALASIAGAPYVAREVGFDLPEFIRITLNAGDARYALGATIGQSLPNWGPVSEAGGRTVAMTNLNNDPDSVAAAESIVASLFCADSASRFNPGDPEPLLVSTLLHEAAHNLGPAGEYRVDGQTDSERFGGRMASMLEELKAQTAALYLTDFLVGRGVIEPALGERMHAADVLWALGKVADGLYEADGSWKAYSHLAMIQIGHLIDQGALSWRAEQPPVDGVEPGCFSLDEAKVTPAIDALAREVLRIKATGDKAGAEALAARYVGDEARWGALRTTVAQRFRRQPQASYVYHITR